MSDRISLMLDNMVAAVEIGFSYDGIISVPETGLEDAGQRPGLSGLVDSGKALVKTTIRAVRTAVKTAENIFKPKPLPTSTSDHETPPTPGPPMDDDPEYVPDSAIDPRKTAELPVIMTNPTQQPSSVETQILDIEEEHQATGLRVEEMSESESPPPSGVGPKQPRQRIDEPRDDIVHVEINVTQSHSTDVQGSKGEQDKEDDGRLPRIRKQREHLKASASEERSQIPTDTNVAEESPGEEESSPDSPRLPRLRRKVKDPRKRAGDK